MPVHRRFTTFFAVLVPLASVAGACSGESHDGPSSPGVLGDGLQTIAGGLAALPESGEETEVVLWGDMARAADIAEVEPPDDPGDTDAVIDYVQILTNGRVDADTTSPVLVVPPQATGVDQSAEMGSFADEMGWSLLDVDWFVERQTAPDVVTVLEGGFDEDAITDALGERSDDLWVAGDRTSRTSRPTSGRGRPPAPFGEVLNRHKGQGVLNFLDLDEVKGEVDSAIVAIFPADHVGEDDTKFVRLKLSHGPRSAAQIDWSRSPASSSGSYGEDWLRWLRGASQHRFVRWIAYPAGLAGAALHRERHSGASQGSAV